jgi:hypothetical protein
VKKQETGADDQGCDHQTKCNVAITRPTQLEPLGLFLARFRCLLFRLLAFCNVPEADDSLGRPSAFRKRLASSCIQR